MQTFMLIMHLAFMGLGIGMSCSNFVNTRLAAGKTGDIAIGLGLQRRTIASIGDSVITVIWLSGFLLLQMRDWEGLNGWFYAKMAFVVALTLSHIMARRTGAEMMRSWQWRVALAGEHVHCRRLGFRPYSAGPCGSGFQLITGYSAWPWLRR